MLDDDNRVGGCARAAGVVDSFLERNGRGEVEAAGIDPEPSRSPAGAGNAWSVGRLDDYASS
jgi:hypothetical protein